MIQLNYYGNRNLHTVHRFISNIFTESISLFPKKIKNFWWGFLRSIFWTILFNFSQWLTSGSTKLNFGGNALLHPSFHRFKTSSHCMSEDHRNGLAWLNIYRGCKGRCEQSFDSINLLKNSDSILHFVTIKCSLTRKVKFLFLLTLNKSVNPLSIIPLHGPNLGYHFGIIPT